MNIPTDNDWSSYRDDIGFFGKNFFGLSREREYLFTEGSNFGLWKWLAGENLCNLFIKVGMIKLCFHLLLTTLYESIQINPLKYIGKDMRELRPFLDPEQIPYTSKTQESSSSSSKLLNYHLLLGRLL